MGAAGWIRRLAGGGAAGTAKALADAIVSARAAGEDVDSLSADLIELMARGRERGGVLARVSGGGGGDDRAVEREVLRVWPALTRDAREAAVAVGGERLEAELRARLGGATVAERIGALEVIGQAGMHALAVAVASSLADGDATVGDAAERTLAALCGSEGVLAAEDGRGVRGVMAGLDRAAELFDRHRRASVIGLWMRMATTVSDIAVSVGDRRNWLDDEQHPAQLVARSRLRRAAEEEVGAGLVSGAAFVWLKYPGLASAARDRLLGPRGRGVDLTWVLERSHLVLNPRRRAALSAGVAAEAGGVAGPEFWGGGVERGVGAVRWVCAQAMGARGRDAALAPMLADERVEVRLALVREGGRLARRPACLVDACFDADGRVARSAALELLATSRREALPEGERRRLIRLLRRSPHAAVRSIAEQAWRGRASAAEHGPGAGAIAGAADGARGGVAEAVLSTVPARMMELRSVQGREAGAGHDAHDARRLLEISSRGLGGRYARAIAEFVRGVDAAAWPMSAATGASVLGESDEPSVVATLVEVTRATGPATARLRANAIDALTRHIRRCHGASAEVRAALLDAAGRSGTGDDGGDGGVGDQGLSAASGGEHRPRAAAARGLIIAGDLMGDATLMRAGTATLQAMLLDDRVMQRVAGAWCAERVAWRLAARDGAHASIAATVGRLASDEGESRAVRARARRAAERLLSEVRAAWGAKAGGVAHWQSGKVAQ